MLCCCENSKVFRLKVEGDVSADPIWCDECYSNLEIEEVPISESLKEKLTEWAQTYGDWMDWDKDVLLPNGVQMEDEHNKIGQLLTAEAQKELGTEYNIRFSPSSSARMYANFDS